ncbi:hypothetical protein ZIOFF_069803 [Zingiber officinale]|uniref:Uncharacterized protein n=1 Tax=Zingiber officinale TaxID=94328 RepID=A0A8J5ES28_ZINOF|nr:hypothetical protein ZIOFF_069803 [Zingiber officinale]
MSCPSSGLRFLFTEVVFGEGDSKCDGQDEVDGAIIGDEGCEEVGPRNWRCEKAPSILLGMVVLREIQKYKKSMELLIQKLSFQHLVREIA